MKATLCKGTHLINSRQAQIYSGAGYDAGDTILVPGMMLVTLFWCQV